MSEYSAHDMATAAAQGFRDGVASVRPDHVEQSAMVVPDGWLIELGFSVLDRPFRFVDSKSHTPTITVILPACEVDDSAAWNLRDAVARRIATMLAAPTPDPASPWISVEDRLPEIGERVIVFTGEVEEAIYWAERDRDGEVVRDGFCDLFDNDVEVSHWMPLPAAPDIAASSGQEV